ncbi:phosphatase PAP2 family protein [Nocardia sp. CDC159]|uniref:Phosphatase PAP2 family protein n=1 Tax=Nocardia pulmonis TaxID=2951408 RepID=A0A9X2J0A9_9NOCA|nr:MULTISPECIES: phosphatase PAP2 family protein [Nocardia]MCM6775766.1 phosphatase PAP2 family protein [Nocardia pulmonis]MCM6788258.1 phosphatase PAP2 family protein [Nocardia sp. CDC159]
MLLPVVTLLSAAVVAVLVRRGTLPAVGAAVLVVLAAVVAELTDSVLDGDGTTRIDPAAMNWVLPRRDDWLTSVAKVITDMGSPTAMTALTLAACAWFAWRRDWPRLIFLAVTAAGSAVIGTTVKPLVGRQRPPVTDQLVVFTNQSFPSGHALGSTVVVGALTVLAALSLQRRAARLALSLVAIIFVVAVGLSRVYLGVHWLTDVLGGWAIGLLWLGICLTGYTRLRPTIPSEPQPA